MGAVKITTPRTVAVAGLAEEVTLRLAMLCVFALMPALVFSSSG